MKLKKLSVVLGLSIFLLIGCSNTQGKNVESIEKIELNISAAASLTEAMDEIQKKYEDINENISLIINYGSSGSLQQQIEQGASCDVFISAGEKQMKLLEEKKLLLDGTYKNLLENDLVLIAHKDSNVNGISDLNTNKVKYLAIGDPESVPAGTYADEVLTNLNIKGLLTHKLVFAKNVKEVLNWVKSENAEAGFVYYSDTIGVDSIKIIETTPDNSHTPIIYPIAIMKDSKQVKAAKDFEEYLLGNEGQDILKKYGYKSIDK